MVSQPSWGDVKVHRRLATLGDALALALVLTPFAMMLLCGLAEYYDDSNTAPEVGLDTLEVLGILAMGTGLAFVASYVCALLIVLGYRFVAGK